MIIVLLVFLLGFSAGKRRGGKHEGASGNYTFKDIDYSKVCCNEKKCTDYRGTKSITQSGLPCQAWDSKHGRQWRTGNRGPDGSWNDLGPSWPSGNENYCRGFKGISIYTAFCLTDTLIGIDECNIPKCSDLSLHDMCLATPGMLSVQRRFGQLAKRLTEVLEEMKAIEDQMEEVETKIDGANKKLKSAQKKCEESKAKITTTRNQASQLKKDLDEAKNRLKEFDSKAMASVKELQEMLHKIKNKDLSRKLLKERMAISL